MVVVVPVAFVVVAVIDIDEYPSINCGKRIDPHNTRYNTIDRVVIMVS